MAELFQRNTVELSAGAVVLGGFALPRAPALDDAIRAVAHAAPWRVMRVPGGKYMSAHMTNCGPWGWVADTKGYGYSAVDPLSGRPWPPMPACFAEVADAAARAAGHGPFAPDACLVNRYDPGAKMGLHRDADEQDFGAPIVSVSLGLAGVFLWGGPDRRDPVRRITLHHGDVVVFGGAARLHYHGVAPVRAGGPAAPAARFNLTLRRAR